MFPPPQESECERRVQSHLCAQMEAFGETLLDGQVLLKLACGTGHYACGSSEEAAFWLAEDYGWKVEYTPPPQTRLMVCLDPVWQRAVRFYHPDQHPGRSQAFDHGCFHSV